MNANLIYEIINWVYAVALGFMVIFVLRYLYEKAREYGWRALLFDRHRPETAALQLAVSILIADSGNWLLRTSTGIWRSVGDTSKLDGLVAVGVILGATVGATGILCKLRVVSIARYGHRPWVMAAAAMAACAAVVVALD